MTQTTGNPSDKPIQCAEIARPITWSQDVLIEMNNDPSISYWLKRAIADLAKRDPLDALYDAELLCSLMKTRWDSWCRTKVEPKGTEGG